MNYYNFSADEANMIKQYSFSELVAFANELNNYLINYAREEQNKRPGLIRRGLGELTEAGATAAGAVGGWHLGEKLGELAGEYVAPVVANAVAGGLDGITGPAEALPVGTPPPPTTVMDVGREVASAARRLDPAVSKAIGGQIGKYAGAVGGGYAANRLAGRPIRRALKREK